MTGLRGLCLDKTGELEMLERNIGISGPSPDMILVAMEMLPNGNSVVTGMNQSYRQAIQMPSDPVDEIVLGWVDTAIRTILSPFKSTRLLRAVKRYMTSRKHFTVALDKATWSILSL
ncbi:hypothetical protein SUNI508_11148 [Seiridium unicorne]|uniref:Uncharacterized protein n=1 Tax=Seiridium unicorne TaxID=138068 RepID=A0ABR2UIX5_9PEZI